MVKLRCIRNADILKRAYLCQVSDIGSPEPLVIHIEHTFCICPFLVAFFSATIDGRNLIFGHKLHIVGSVF
jgi:hypothetical protein